MVHKHYSTFWHDCWYTGHPVWPKRYLMDTTPLQNPHKWQLYRGIVFKMDLVSRNVFSWPWDQNFTRWEPPFWHLQICFHLLYCSVATLCCPWQLLVFACCLSPGRNEEPSSHYTFEATQSKILYAVSCVAHVIRFATPKNCSWQHIVYCRGTRYSDGRIF